MKKAKWTFCGLIFIFLGLIVFQNWDFFHPPTSFKINFWIERFTTPKWPVWAYVLIVFFIGFATMFLLAMPGWFKSAKNMKSLNETIANQRKELDDLKKEIGELVRGSSRVEPETEQPASEEPTAETTVDADSSETEPTVDAETAKPAE